MTRMKFLLCAVSLCGAAAFTRLAWTQDNRFDESNPRSRPRTTIAQEPTELPQPVPGGLEVNSGSSDDAPGFAPDSGGFRVRSRGGGAMRPRTVTRYVNEIIYEPVSEQEALEAQKLQQAMHLLKTGTDEAAKKKATDVIQEQLAKQFERDLSQREKELATVEERVKSLRQQLDKRKAAKDDIISLRLKTIVNNAEGLGFPGESGVSEGTPYGDSSFGSVPPRSAEGIDFVPTRVPAIGVPARTSTTLHE